jgi:hypothetical protein
MLRGLVSQGGIHKREFMAGSCKQASFREVPREGGPERRKERPAAFKPRASRVPTAFNDEMHVDMPAAKPFNLHMNP